MCYIEISVGVLKIKEYISNYYRRSWIQIFHRIVKENLIHLYIIYYLHKYGAALAVLVQPFVQAVICHTKGGLLYGALATVLASVPLSRLAEVSFILIREAGIIQGVIDLERGVLVFVVICVGLSVCLHVCVFVCVG